MINARSLEAVHTHTHTRIIFNRVNSLEIGFINNGNER